MDPCTPGKNIGNPEERRAHFRIQEMLPVLIRRLEGPSCPEARILIGPGSGIALGLAPEADDAELPAALRRRLAQIDAKLNLILERLYTQQDQPPPAQSRLVSLSASGMRFSTAEVLAVGDLVEVRLMVLDEDITWLVLYGRVIRSTPDDRGEADVAVCFLGMDVAVREALIRYTLRRQREQILRRRGDKD